MNELVSINIPTYNSAKFLELCLYAIKHQTYKNIEVVIVDGYSSDDTLKIAKKMGVKKIYLSKIALLGARELACGKSKGKYILLLDSDQILKKDCIERAVRKISKYDMLILEEDVYKANNWIEKLFQMDRKLIHKVKDYSPYTGVMLPRFYKIDLLERVFDTIPNNIKHNVSGQDHAIIYLEAWNISKKVNFLQNSVSHIEPNTLRLIWKKFYRWGYTSVGARKNKYDELLKEKERFRTGLFEKNYYRESISSILLLIMKGIPYKFGVSSAKFKNLIKK